MSEEQKKVKPLSFDIEATAKFMRLWIDNQEMVKELLGWVED